MKMPRRIARVWFRVLGARPRSARRSRYAALREVPEGNALQRVRPIHWNMEHQNDLIGIRIRKRSQKHRIDNAENRGAGADAQGKSDYSGGGEGGRLSQHANAVSYVLGEILNPVHTPSVAALFFDLVYRSK